MDNEKLFTLIKSPIITEQTALLGENLKQIVFKGDLSANKREIKQAVDLHGKDSSEAIKLRKERDQIKSLSILSY